MPTVTTIENVTTDLGLVNNEIVNNKIGCKLCEENHDTDMCVILNAAKHIKDKIIFSRARLTLPSELRIENMSDGSTNIISQVPLPKGTRFGPYEGKKVQILNPLVQFPIKLFGKEVENDYYFEPHEDLSNWMIFVTPASNIEEQNLVCYQLKNEIYFSTNKDVNAGEFLKVWYACYYAEKMGSPLLNNRTPVEIPMPDTDLEKAYVQKVAETLPAVKLGAVDDEISSWTCKFCLENFTNVVPFAKHLQNHYREISRNPSLICNICQKYCFSEKSFINHQKMEHPSIVVHKGEETLSTNQINNTAINLNFNNSSEISVDESPKTFCKLPPFNSTVEFNSKSVVCDALVGGQTHDQLEPSSLLENISIHSINYNQDIMNNVMLSKMSEFNDHIKFDLKDSTDITDTLNPDALHDILCEDTSKASKIAQEKSIADFSLDFVETNIMSLNSNDTIDTLCSDLSTQENIAPSAKEAATLEPPFSCDICKKEFQTIKYLLRHLKKHTGEFTCIYCHVVFGRRENYINHSCKRTMEIGLECIYCSKQFAEQKYLNRHLETHKQKIIRKTQNPTNTTVDEDKKFQCKMCNMKFSKSAYLRRHVKNCHKDTGGIQICYICGEIFKKSYLLHQHIITHQTKKFSCDICDKKFNRQDVCNAHKLAHQECQFQCNVCSKVFKREKNLKLHMYTHTDPYKYKCDYCERSFIQSYNYDKHLKTRHPNEQTKPKDSQNINDTEQKSKDTTQLQEDSNNTQLNEKNFSCQYCNMLFVKKYELNNHYVQSHIERMFSCPYCKTVVKHRASIRRHLMKTHREKQSEWDNPNFIRNLISLKDPIDEKKVIKSEDKIQNNEVHSTANITSDENGNENILSVDPSDNCDNILSKLTTANSPQVNSTQYFNANVAIQNMIYLKDNLSLVKDDEYDSIENESKLNQFSDLTNVNLQYSNESNDVYDVAVKRQRIESDRPADFELMDIQSLITSDNGLLHFSNEINSNLMELNRTNITETISSTTTDEISSGPTTNMIQLSDNDSAITLGRDAYILEDGIIVAPQETGNVMFYVLNQ